MEICYVCLHSFHLLCHKQLDTETSKYKHLSTLLTIPSMFKIWLCNSLNSSQNNKNNYSINGINGESDNSNCSDQTAYTVLYISVTHQCSLIRSMLAECDIRETDTHLGPYIKYLKKKLREKSRGHSKLNCKDDLSRHLTKISFAWKCSV